MKVESVAITKLKPDLGNPRTMPAKEAAALRRSLEEWGPVEPAVINRDGTIIGGHQRVAAAQELGWSEFPVVRLDLTKEKARLLNLALNRIDGEWDEDKLSAMLADLNGNAGDVDLLLSGFDAGEVTRLLDAAGDQVDAPEPIKRPRKPRTRAGDLIRLGDHRLLCGDATEPDHYRRVLEGPAAAMWTDPPYGVDYTGKTKDALKIANDDAGKTAALLTDAWAAADPWLVPGAPIYCCSPPGALQLVFGAAFMAAGWRLHEFLIWVKDVFVLGHADYHFRHEPILFGYKPGNGRRGRGGSGWYGDNAQDTVYEIERPKVSKLHPTIKPVRLVEETIANSTIRGDVVLDPFAGSGSTIIAADRLERRCAAIELDPGYCDVIVQRWQDATGRKARWPRRS